MPYLVLQKRTGSGAPIAGFSLANLQTTSTMESTRFGEIPWTSGPTAWITDISPDGTSILGRSGVSDPTEDAVQFSLATPYDLTSAVTYVGRQNTDGPSGALNVSEAKWGEDGNLLFVWDHTNSLGISPAYLRGYYLNSPYGDISSIAGESELNIASYLGTNGYRGRIAVGGSRITASAVGVSHPNVYQWGYTWNGTSLTWDSSVPVATVNFSSVHGITSTDYGMYWYSSGSKYLIGGVYDGLVSLIEMTASTPYDITTLTIETVVPVNTLTPPSGSMTTGGAPYTVIVNESQKYLYLTSYDSTQTGANIRRAVRFDSN